MVLAIVAVVKAGQLQKDVRKDVPPQPPSPSGPGPQFRPVRRIAFGSCSAYDLRPQAIWVDGVIPVQPDAWIWVGDMAYLDTSPVDCGTLGAAAAALRWCNCSSEGYMATPRQCMAGNVNYARDRWTHALQDVHYRTFLDFMCPPGNGTASDAGSQSRPAGSGALAGRFPPVGTDPAVCPRPIFGVYDDHDYGWNNGNRRLPNKAEYKRMFLDAVGEAPDSPRRGADAGLQGVYKLNGGGPGRDIDLVLLDERWYRDPLPCSLRRAWCEGELAKPESKSLGWCRDFLLDDGVTGLGSCCAKDDDLVAWCALPASRSSPLWSAACDPTSQEWGLTPVVLGPDNTTLLRVNGALWDSQQQALWPRLWQAADSPVCEVLGSAQRRWLSRHLSSSQAALTIVASGSVLLGGVGWEDPASGLRCSGDDWACWTPAQINLLQTLANTSAGCVVVLTGDFHFGDIKVATAGSNTQYASLLKTDKLQKPVYQVMASGMTVSTAHYPSDLSSCRGTFKEDLVGLRPRGACSYTPKPNFGLIEVDWEEEVVHLTLRNADGGGIATGLDNSSLHVAFSLKTCAPVPV